MFNNQFPLSMGDYFSSIFLNQIFYYNLGIVFDILVWLCHLALGEFGVHVGCHNVWNVWLAFSGWGPGLYMS